VSSRQEEKEQRKREREERERAAAAAAKRKRLLQIVGAVVVGVPCGIAVGRWTWHLVASGLGSVSPSIVPVAAVLAVIPATLLVANVLAAGPGWLAARVPPAETLHTE